MAFSKKNVDHTNSRHERSDRSERSERSDYSEVSERSDYKSNCICAKKVQKCAQSDCNFLKHDICPFGITIIPGSGTLTEFPSTEDSHNIAEDGTHFLQSIRDIDYCPKAFPPTPVCVRECPDFAALASINFINGDLIISDSELILGSAGSVSIAQLILPAADPDLLNIFPNLLGVNGSIYIVNTQYRRITGFERLRFVTGSIIIANNESLIIIPTFPGLLSVGGLVTFIPPISPTDPIVQQLPEFECGISVIVIANNPILRKITGFDAVRQVKDGIYIANNNCLTHICGFIHLYRTGRIVIAQNFKLSKIVGFCNIDAINIGLYILDNNRSGDLDLVLNAFISLETAGRVVIIGNYFLKAVKLPSLQTVVNEFVVRSNCHIEELSSCVQFVNDLSIENNKALLCIRLPALVEVNNLMNINCNSALQSLDTFEKLKRVGGAIMISDNRQLTELKGFCELKYVGASCASAPLFPVIEVCAITSCLCTTDISYDWEFAFQRDLLEPCVIISNFQLDAFDSAVFSCLYQLSLDFFELACHPAPQCGEIEIDTETPTTVSYSIIIFRNSRLRAIGGFSNLRHVNSNIYIIDNSVLHTINAFGCLAYALDVWIRNNPQLRYIIGFSSLLSIRDLIILESVCLCEFNGLKCLEFAQNIAIESRTAKAVRYPDNAIPSVLGYNLYYSFDKC